MPGNAIHYRPTNGTTKTKQMTTTEMRHSEDHKRKATSHLTPAGCLQN